MCSCHGSKLSASEDSFDKAWKVSAYYIAIVVGIYYQLITEIQVAGVENKVQSCTVYVPH